MGAMKRLLEAVYETLQETEGFRRLGTDEQGDAAMSIASDIIHNGPMECSIEQQIRVTIGERGF